MFDVTVDVTVVEPQALAEIWEAAFQADVKVPAAVETLPCVDCPFVGCETGEARWPDCALCDVPAVDPGK